MHEHPEAAAGAEAGGAPEAEERGGAGGGGGHGGRREGGREGREIKDWRSVDGRICIAGCCTFSIALGLPTL